MESRVEENSYRQSRLCRLLGNPVALAAVELLAENQELNPNEIARAVGRSVQRVSNVLGYGHIYQSGSKFFPSSRIKPRSM
jgi:predicted transcriptional regulator